MAVLPLQCYGVERSGAAQIIASPQVHLKAWLTGTGHAGFMSVIGINACPHNTH